MAFTSDKIAQIISQKSYKMEKTRSRSGHLRIRLQLFVILLNVGNFNASKNTT